MIKINQFSLPLAYKEITYGICYSCIASNEKITLNDEIEAYRWIFLKDISKFDHIINLDKEISSVFGLKKHKVNKV